MTVDICLLNVVAGAYVLGARAAVLGAGRALGAGDDVEPQLLLAGWAGAGGAHDYLAAQHPDGAVPGGAEDCCEELQAGACWYGAGRANISSEADCMPQAKKKAKTDSKPAAAKKPGPALSALEAALQPEKVYNVEKLLASRLAGGKKEYKVRWEGYGEKHDSWEPMENLSNLVQEMAAFDLAKEKANQDHLDEG